MQVSGTRKKVTSCVGVGFFEHQEARSELEPQAAQLGRPWESSVLCPCRNSRTVMTIRAKAGFP